MIDFKIIYKVIGALLYYEATLMLFCLAMSFGYREDDGMAFLVSAIITAFFGVIMRYAGRKAGNNLSRREAYLVVTLAWSLFSLFGTLPFLISGYLTDFTDAYFETMSGFTTTGATIIDDVERLPHGLLFWRSLTQWVGGLGIVFFTVVLLPSMTGGSTKIFAAESTGPIKTKLHPRLQTSARWIFLVYISITIACTLSYMLFGMGLFDAVNYAMSSAATGGFSTHNNSTEFFNSPGIDYVTTFFCFVSGINFTLLYYTAAKLRIRSLWHNSEFRLYLLITLSFTLFIMLELIFRNHYEIEHAFRAALFQVVSFITTTGLFNENAALWPHVTWVLLAFCMFIGACSGSTTGGFKCVRGLMLWKIMKNEFVQILHPNAVLPLKIDGVNVSQQKRVTLLAFLTAYLLLCLINAFVMIAMGVDNTNAITITLSCLGNVGPTLGIEIGPTMSWSMLPEAAKWMCSVMMLIGRLEVFTVLVIFVPSFWTKN